MNKTVNIILWAAKLLAAIIMLQTLFFKFSASPESVYIFTTVGMEPWGRYAVGVGELIASILLLIPSLGWMGACMGIGLMAGALSFHLTKLGISILGDGGYLFFLGVTVMVTCLLVLYLDRFKAFAFVEKYFKIKLTL